MSTHHQDTHIRDRLDEIHHHEHHHQETVILEDTPIEPADIIKPNPSTSTVSIGDGLTPPESTVPKLANDEQIFELLCKKIAKYCQLLAKLTSCEVFYKAELTRNSSGSKQNLIDDEQRTSDTTSRTRPKRYQPKNIRNPNVRSLYWGTNRLLYEFSHERGIRFEKSQGDSLIDVEHGTSVAVENIESIIDEIVNGPGASIKKPIVKRKEASELQLSGIKEVSDEKTRTSIVLKDCFVRLNRLDDCIVEAHLGKFETASSVDDRLPSDEELYSDADNINRDDMMSMDAHERILLGINGLEVRQGENEIYTCEFCVNHSYRHLTQLKLHQLRTHEKPPNFEIRESAPFKCDRCHETSVNRVEYLKHIVTCLNPDVFKCPTCHKSHTDYARYHFHTTYIHPPLIYMCTLCSRKFRRMNDLVEHDALVHVKTNAQFVCELCNQIHDTRASLNDHYVRVHVNKEKQVVNEEVKKSLGDNENQHQEELVREMNVTETDQTCVELVGKEIKDQTGGSLQPVIQKKTLIRGLIDRKFQCRYCEDKFFQKKHLQNHEQSHHKNTTLNCPVCDKVFTRRDRLNGHMKCHMEPSLECKICHKKFKRPCNLYNHELVHGLTEHAFMLCQYCQRGFRSRRDYHNHVIAKHRDELLKSDESSIHNLTNSSYSSSSSNPPTTSTTTANVITRVRIIDNHENQNSKRKRDEQDDGEDEDDYSDEEEEEEEDDEDDEQYNDQEEEETFITHRTETIDLSVQRYTQLINEETDEENNDETINFDRGF